MDKMLLDAEVVRKMFPVLDNMTFLNIGAAGPLPLSVIDEMEKSLRSQMNNGRITLSYYEKMWELKSNIRNLIADLTGTDGSEIAITRSTCEGLNIVLNGIGWKEGDSIITTNAEHITLYSPVYCLKKKFNLNVQLIDAVNNFSGIAENLETMIRPETRLICLSHISYCTGDLLPVKRICEIAHRYNIPVLVDGAQSFASIPLNLKELGCDFFAGPGQKWICGPEGTGFLYVSKSSLDKIHPAFTGYDSVKSFDFETGLVLNETAVRFENGTCQPADLSGFFAALKLHKELGQDSVYARNLRLAAEATHILRQNKNIKILTQSSETGLVAFYVNGNNSQDVVNALLARKVVCRAVPITNAVRISTGFYNTAEEIKILADLLFEITDQNKN
jgi:L-cysteine/cystine lyase